MKNGLKQSLIKKLDITPSAKFDAQFFEKLEKTNRHKGFSNWVTLAISGCATASVLFISISSYNAAHRATFNHREYVESVLEVQQSMTEEISNDDMIDLTSLFSDEI
jgi:hypothetical protein